MSLQESEKEITTPPTQETAEARAEAAPKKEGFKVVRLEEVAARREAAAQAEVRTAELVENSARADIALAQEAAGKHTSEALRSRLLADGPKKELVAQKAAADREAAAEQATKARAAKELIAMEQDPAALSAWEQTREKEAGELQKALKENPEDKKSRARLAEVTTELNTAVKLTEVKQELLKWNRGQQPRQETLN